MTGVQTCALPILGTMVTLDGSASKDADGNPLTFQWTLTAKPLGSAAAISDPGSMRPTITVDMSGEYIAQLIINDGMASSIPDTVIVRTTVPAPAPGVYISRARWNASTTKLTVAGRAPKNASVEIRDADSGTLLATAVAGDAGRFRAYVTPPVVPCAIQATSNGLLSGKTPVAGAPANCGLAGGAQVQPQSQEQEQDDSVQRRRRSSR